VKYQAELPAQSAFAIKLGQRPGRDFHSEKSFSHSHLNNVKFDADFSAI